jgi:hypothetical protein
MNSEQTKLDKFLNDALKNYSDAEPRLGFESRIIANLRVAPARPWWYGRVAYASAAIVMVCVISYGVYRQANSRPEIAPPALANRVPAPEVVRSGPRVAAAIRNREPDQRRVQTRRNGNEQQRVTQASQLPVPMPLTHQEKLLLAFARENPKEVASTVEWQERMREPAEQPTVSDRGEQQ